MGRQLQDADVCRSKRKTPGACSAGGSEYPLGCRPGRTNSAGRNRPTVLSRAATRTTGERFTRPRVFGGYRSVKNLRAEANRVLGPQCGPGLAPRLPALPARAFRAILQHDAAGGEVRADPVGLGEVAALAGGVAGLDLRLDLRREDLGAAPGSTPSTRSADANAASAGGRAGRVERAFVDRRVDLAQEREERARAPPRCSGRRPWPAVNPAAGTLPLARSASKEPGFAPRRRDFAEARGRRAQSARPRRPRRRAPPR